MNVSVYKTPVRGKDKWCVDRVEDGRRKRSFFALQSDASSLASALRATGRAVVKAWRRVSHVERERLMDAYRDAMVNGHDLQDLLNEARHKPAKLTGPRYSKVVTELIAAKLAAGRNRDYVEGLESFYARFRKSLAGDIGIHEIGLTAVEKFLDAHSLAYRSTLRSNLSTLFKFAIRRGYRPDNPCARLEAVTYVKPPPQVFTPAQFSTAVDWLLNNARYGLGWFALSTACGLRPEEAEQTDPKRDIDFREGFVRVEAQTTKVRMRRVVYPKKEAMAFLKWALKKGGRLPLDSQSRKRLIAGQPRKNKEGRRRSLGLRDALGFKKWPKDITRHTAASYWLADCGSTAIVAEALGHSEATCKKDYKALVTRAQAKDFYRQMAEFAKPVQRTRKRGRRKTSER